MLFISTILKEEIWYFFVDQNKLFLKINFFVSLIESKKLKIAFSVYVHTLLMKDFNILKNSKSSLNFTCTIKVFQAH